MIMSKHKKQNEKAILFIILAIIAFVLRYIPFNKVWTGQYKSIDGMTTICNSFLGTFANYCDWVNLVNITLILASIAALIYGLYILYKNR